ncbi:MAG: rod shape-determining protein MreC [Candidatus Staskawiczbacteria bacterium]|jgi:rod shape-determining protein MreC
MNAISKFSINKKKRNWPKFLIILGAILLFLIILNIFVSPVRNYFFTISSAIQKTFWTAGTSSSGLISSLLKSGSLTKENEDLKKQNQNLLYQVAFLQSIEQGNRAQSDVSISCQNTGFQFVMAGVIGLDKDILSIGKGSVDGVSIGMPVINQQNVLVGKVFKVYKNFSDIMLISNKNSVINVKVQQQNIASEIIIVNPDGTTTTSTDPAPETVEIAGVIRGSGALSAYLDLIPVNSEINSDDVLVTSSLEKSFPKDLLVGKITQNIKNDQKPFQQAKISLFFDVKNADNVFVITNYKKDN